MISKRIRTLILFIAFSNVTFGQSIEVSNEQKLDLGLQDKIMVENQLTQHPEDPNYLMLSGMYVDKIDPDDFRTFASISRDNGKTWTTTYISELKEAADPWGVFSTKGTAIFSMLGPSERSLGVFIKRSMDAGETWESGLLELAGNHDHQTMVVNPADNTIYVLSIDNNHVYVNYSSDDGQTFNNPNKLRINNLEANTMTPVVLSNGTLMVSATNYARPAINGSRNNGRTERLKNTLDWVISYSKEDGFGVPMLIGEVCGSGFPVLSIDSSETEYKDNLYYVCSNPTNNEVLFFYSDTKGTSWSAPIVVSKFLNVEQPKRNPFTGIPQIAINPDGVIGVVWQDRMSDPEGKCQYLVFAASMDGGKTFSKPANVSSQRSCMEKEENDWAGNRYKSGGDYTGFIAKPDGSFQTIWPDSRQGISQLYMATIKVGN